MAGERYSYLNSLRVGTEGYGAGSVWYPKLGFSPYVWFFCYEYIRTHTTHCANEINARITCPITSVDANDTLITSPYDWDYNDTSTPSNWDLTYSANRLDGTTYGTKPIHLRSTDNVTRSLHHPQGIFSWICSGIIQCELALIAKHDRAGIKATGDWLTVVFKTGQSVSVSMINFVGTADG